MVGWLMRWHVASCRGARGSHGFHELSMKSLHAFAAAASSSWFAGSDHHYWWPCSIHRHQLRHVTQRRSYERLVPYHQPPPYGVRCDRTDMRAAQRFFRSARSVAGFVPDRVTTDRHNSYPRAIRSTLGRRVRHRTSVYLNNRLEQDHRGIKGRIRCMRASRSMTRPTGSAESTMNSETSFAADPVTTNTFLQPGDAVTFSTTHASRSVSCRSQDQHNSHRSLHHITARDVTEPFRWLWFRTLAGGTALVEAK